MRMLGRTGLRISELCLGTMMFGRSSSRDEARAILKRFADQGGNFVDTAVNYAEGASEEILGELLANERDRFVIATKYTAPLRRDDPNSGGNHAKSLRQALERSLSRLRTDYVDLYWVHAWDPATPLEELVAVLDDAVRSGKVLHAGLSNFPAWAVARSSTLAEVTARVRVAAIQVEYNLLERTAERELLPMSQQLGLSVLAWGPLAGGALTGKYLPLRSPVHDGRLARDDRRRNERSLSITTEVAAVASEHGVPPSAVALSWLRSQPSRPVPILGPRTPEQLDQLLACLEVHLPENALDRLDRASTVSLGYPHEFLTRIRAAYSTSQPKSQPG